MFYLETNKLNMHHLITKNEINTLVETKDVSRYDMNEDGLELYSYISCSSQDSPLKKNCRGVVFHEDKLVLQTFPYTENINTKNREEVENALSNLNDWNFYPSYEGSLLRVYCYNNRWYISTHKKFNAFHSRWASNISFGVRFVQLLTKLFNLPQETNYTEVLNKFYSMLNTHKQYAFLISHWRDNSIREQETTTPGMYYVGTWDATTNTLIPFDEEVSKLINTPQSYNFTSIDEIYTKLQELSTMPRQGIIAFSKTENQQLKLYTPSYYDEQEVRGNTNSIQQRYLELRNQPEKFEKFLEMYRERYGEQFTEFESIINEMIKLIFTTYKKRFCYKDKREDLTIPKMCYQIMKECHSWHFQDPSQNKISEDKVRSLVNTTEPLFLLRMINEFKRVRRTRNRQNYRENENVEFVQVYQQQDNNNSYSRRAEGNFSQQDMSHLVRPIVVNINTIPTHVNSQDFPPL